MKKTLVAVLSALTLLSIQACAQRKVVSDYNYRKAVEAYFEDDDDEKALELLNKQIDDTPNHIDSRFIRARIYWSTDKYDAALRDISYAIKHYKGKPSARKDNPEKVQSYHFDLAQALYMSDEFDNAEKEYRAMLKTDPSDVTAMIGLARFYRDKEEYEESLKWLETAESYNSEYGEIYKFKMQVYDKMDREDDTVDAALKYFELDDDAEAWYVADYAKKHYTYGVARIKAEMNKEEDASSRWIVLLTRLYEDHCDYLHALELYNKVESEYGEHPMISYYKSSCYRELGQFKKAISEATKAIELSEDQSLYSHRGDIYRSAGMYKEAIADYQVLRYRLVP